MGNKAGRSTFALETEAISDLVERMRIVRRRVVLPFAVGVAVVGHLGIAAHVFGYWSVSGILYKEHYSVHFLTIAAAFLLPSAPIVVLGIVIYFQMRSRTRKLWQKHYAREGLNFDWLNSTADRFV